MPAHTHPSEWRLACRWNLRSDRVAMGILSAIADGEGVEDLVQDLSDCAELMERRAAAFAADTTFDVAAKVKRARELGAKIREGLSAERLTTEQAETRRFATAYRRRHRTTDRGVTPVVPPVIA